MITFTFNGEAVSIDDEQVLFNNWIMRGITSWRQANKYATLGDGLEVLMQAAVDKLGYTVLEIVAIANADFGDDQLGLKMLQAVGHPCYNITCGTTTIIYPYGDAPFSPTVNGFIYGYMASIMGVDMSNVHANDIKQTIENMMNGAVSSGVGSEDFAADPANWNDNNAVTILNHLGFVCSL